VIFFLCVLWSCSCVFVLVFFLVWCFVWFVLVIFVGGLFFGFFLGCLGVLVWGIWGVLWCVDVLG